MFPMLYSKLRYQYPMYPIIYSVGMTPMMCSIPYQKINFILKGEEMTTTDSFVKPEEDSFAAFSTYLNVFLLLSLGGYWACVGS